MITDITLRISNRNWKLPPNFEFVMADEQSLRRFLDEEIHSSAVSAPGYASVMAIPFGDYSGRTGTLLIPLGLVSSWADVVWLRNSIGRYIVSDEGSGKIDCPCCIGKDRPRLEGQTLPGPDDFTNAEDQRFVKFASRTLCYTYDERLLGVPDIFINTGSGS